jgi:metal-responsive CopG/Arc/MetJ family transcriptional regulator
MQNKPRTEKINLALPARLVEAIDEVAQRQLRTRSEYIRQATLKRLEDDGFCLLSDGDNRRAA